ncbi:hypothetical protein [Lewinella sp. JB7]|uniref:hypothetical protein n=1 Tax=Lewinella sp. JB7 TaxID=2962887 RepID=UPI0020C9B077|nr:hypothetical protein [Lewinella sp. JB7]MCP9237085.1 hypothetical protein [Lewinella sp. JB7]
MPRISLNKLGEYVEASLARRKAIVKDAKYPPVIKVARYSEVRTDITAYFTSGYDDNVLKAAIKKFEEKKPESPWHEQNQRGSIDFLELLPVLELPDLHGFDVLAYKGDNPKMNIAGVDISVNPDAIIKGHIKDKPVVGAIKYYTSKGVRIGEEGSKTIATLLSKFVEENLLQGEEKVCHDFCLSVDFHGEQVYSAPKAFKRRLQNVETACEEIRLRWDSL